MIEQVLSKGPFSMHEIARETGMSYDALRSWATGRRVPRRKNVEQLAAYLEQHGKQLQEFAEDLRREIENEES